MRSRIFTVLMLLVALVMVIPGLPPAHAANNVFPQTGPYLAASDVTVLNAFDVASQQKMYFAQGRWWAFYPGQDNAGHIGTMNYTTSVTGTSGWVEHGVPLPTNTGTYAGLSGCPANSWIICFNDQYALDQNATTVFLEVTPSKPYIYFIQGNMHADGTVTWFGQQTVTTSLKACAGTVTGMCVNFDDAHPWHTANPEILYFFWSWENITSNNKVTGMNYTYTTNAAMTTFATPQLVHSYSNCEQNGWFTNAKDMNIGPPSALYIIYWQFFFPDNCNGGLGTPQIGYFGRQIAQGVMQAEENIPVSPGWYSTGVPGALASIGFINTVSPGVMTASFTYDQCCSPTNRTGFQVPLFATRPVGGPWPAPLPPTGTAFSRFQQASSGLGAFCSTYDSVNGLYTGAGPQGQGGGDQRDYVHVFQYGNPTFSYLTDTVPPISLKSPTGYPVCPEVFPISNGAIYGQQNGTARPWQFYAFQMNLQGITPVSEGANANLFQDDFLYSNPFISNSWTIAKYFDSGSTGLSSGVYTSGGYMYLDPSSSLGLVNQVSVHVNSPAVLSGAGFPDYTTVKRKVTVGLIPFPSQPNAVSGVEVGLTHLITAVNGFPVAGGLPPYGTPNTDSFSTPSACKDSSIGSDNFGNEYVNINSTGTVTWVTCNDTGTFPATGVRLGGSLLNIDVTKYTVVTIEIYGISCKACTDNVVPGSSWVWFRMYQEDSSGNIIQSSDNNFNKTTGVTPFNNYSPTYFFANLHTCVCGTPTPLSKIDIVQWQNFGSPVLLGQINPTPIPPPFISGSSSFPDILAWAANFLGQGNVVVGGWILFGVMGAIITLAMIFFTQDVVPTGLTDIGLMGLFIYDGLLPGWMLFVVFAVGAFIAYGIFQKASQGMFGGGGGGKPSDMFGDEE